MLCTDARLSIVEAFASKILFFKVTDTPYDPLVDKVSFSDSDLGSSNVSTFSIPRSQVHTLTQTGEVKINCTLEEEDGNGFSWTEVGLYDDQSRLVCRQILETPFQKTSLRTVSWQFLISFNHALLKIEACP